MGQVFQLIFSMIVVCKMQKPKLNIFTLLKELKFNLNDLSPKSVGLNLYRT